jgi:hypothetical protein
VQRGSSIVGFTETTIDKSGFLRWIAVVGTDLERHRLSVCAICWGNELVRQLLEPTCERQLKATIGIGK